MMDDQRVVSLLAALLEAGVDAQVIQDAVSRARRVRYGESTTFNAGAERRSFCFSEVSRLKV